MGLLGLEEGSHCKLSSTIFGKMSAELCWSILRKNSCFLVKSHGLTLTKEANNLTGINSFKYNGLVNKKTVGVDAAPSGKGVVLSLRKTKGKNCPSKSITKTSLQGSRHTIKTIQNTLSANGYRKDLTDAAVRRACAIIRPKHCSCQKETIAKKEELNFSLNKLRPAK